MHMHNRFVVTYLAKQSSLISNIRFLMSKWINIQSDTNCKTWLHHYFNFYDDFYYFHHNIEVIQDYLFLFNDRIFSYFTINCVQRYIKLDRVRFLPVLAIIVTKTSSTSSDIFIITVVIINNYHNNYNTG